MSTWGFEAPGCFNLDNMALYLWKRSVKATSWRSDWDKLPKRIWCPTLDVLKKASNKNNREKNLEASTWSLLSTKTTKHQIAIPGYRKVFHFSQGVIFCHRPPLPHLSWLRPARLRKALFAQAHDVAAVSAVLGHFSNGQLNPKGAKPNMENKTKQNDNPKQKKGEKNWKDQKNSRKQRTESCHT